MFLTYTDIKKAHFRNIGKAGQFSDATLLEDFQYSLGQRYQMIMGTLSQYINQDTLTASTVAAQQYYYYPVGTVGVDTATVTVGSQKYPLTFIYSQEMWDYWNVLPIQPTTFPQFIFPRKDDFGIWPIPQDVYTITFNRFFRDRNLLVDDYTGTCSLTSGSATVTGSGTTFTPAMVGRWFTITDTTVPGQGYWYRVGGYTSATSITLETVWAAATAPSATFKIGECPEIPAEGHTMLPSGTAADYYSGLRNDVGNALRFDNMFWTGSMAQASRDWDDKQITGGLIGIHRKYKDRGRDVIVRRQPHAQGPYASIFSQTIT